MGSFFNSNDFEDSQQLDGCSGKTTNARNSSLAGQSSMDSLTFDELQGTSTFSGDAKDFGSVNMEDLLRNFWTTEENQAFASLPETENSIAPTANAERQGSLTLSRTLSQKTVDEVWRDIVKESTTDTIPKNDSLGLKQNTLSEMTLEEFLLREEVEREDPQQPVKQENAGSYGALAQPRCGNRTVLDIGFQPALNLNVLHNQFLENSNPVRKRKSSDITLNLGNQKIYRLEQHKGVQSQHQYMYSNEADVTLPSGMPLGSDNYPMVSPQINVPVVAVSNSSSKSMLAQTSAIPDGAAGLSALCNLPASGVTISAANFISSNVTAKGELDTPPVSPLHDIGEGGRGWRSNINVEKVIERRRKRMIKNRESASRSRARKQAYTLELEEEVAHLKEINQELEKEQAEFMEMQKIQTLQTAKKPGVEESRRLERALTGPW